MQNESFFKELMTVVYNGNLTIKKIINPQSELLLSFDAAKLIGRNLNELEYLSPLDDKAPIQTIVENVRNTCKGEKNFFKYQIELSDKKVDAVCMSEHHSDGNIYVNVIRTNQHCISESKEFFNNFIFNSDIYTSPIGFTISHISKDGDKHYLIFNDAIRKIYCSDDVTSSANWNEVEETNTDTLALENKTYTYDKKLYDESGNINKWITTTKQYVNSKDGGCFIVSTITDVTSLVNKYSLVSELKLYASLYNSVPLSVAVYDVDGILRSVNTRYLKLFRIDYHTIINTRNIKSDKNIPQWAFEKIAKGETVTYNNIYEISETENSITKESVSHTHLLSVNLVPIKDSNHNIVGYSQTFDDITERNIDKHLLDIVHKHLPVGLILYDKDGNLLNLNYKNREIMGIPPSEDLSNVNLFEEPNLSEEYIRRLKNGEDVVFELDYDFSAITGYFETSNNHLKRLQITITVIRNNEFIDGYLLMNQDMTSIKKKEIQLEEDNKKLDIALKNSGMFFWEYNCDEKYFRSNDYGIFVNKEKHKTLDDYENVIAASDRSKFKNIKYIIENRINNGFCEEGVFVNQQTNERRNIIFSGEPYLVESSGKVISYVGYRKDITNEKVLDDHIKLLNVTNKSILDNIDFGLAYIDNNYKIIWSNAVTLNGDDLNRFKLYIPGNTCYKVVFNRDTPCEHCVIKDSLKCGHKVIHSDVKIGNNFYEISALPVTDSSSLTPGHILKISDITQSSILNKELIKRKDELKGINLFLKTIIRTIPVGISIKDSITGNYIMVNEVFANIFNKKSNELEGKNISEICNKKNGDEIQYNDKITKELKADSHSFIINYNNGEKEIPLEFHKALVSVSENKEYIISVLIDMSEKINTIRELNIAKAQAEESDKLKSAFLANMSHEIRTPLNSIVGFSEIIATNDNKKENIEYFKIIQHNNQILLRLINDILDLSKIEAGVIKLENKEFDLAELDNNFTAFYDSNKQSNDVEFIMDLPYRRCIVNLDEQRFMQVCNNFISNAIKYTTKGYIKYGYKYENNGIKVYVKDTGMGIPKAVQHKLFTRFGKLNDYIQGNGLGLTICKAIIDIQNGEIGFESEENQGSTFWAWFPTNADVEERLQNKRITINHIESRNSVLINNNTQNEISKNSILVAEDNDSNFLLLKALLKGYPLVRVENGLEAVEKAKSGSFNIILMDIKMPKMNGIDATKQIRKFNKDVIIVALTANAFDSDTNIINEAGCDEVITKPITSEGRKVLLSIIDSIE